MRASSVAQQHNQVLRKPSTTIDGEEPRIGAITWVDVVRPAGVCEGRVISFQYEAEIRQELCMASTGQVIALLMICHLLFCFDFINNLDILAWRLALQSEGVIQVGFNLPERILMLY